MSSRQELHDDSCPEEGQRLDDRRRTLIDDLAFLLVREHRRRLAACSVANKKVDK